MKLGRLQPRLATLNTSIGTPLVFDRMRGRGRLERNRRFLETHPWCEQGCGRPATEVDHRVPLHLGGIDGEPNLQSLCHDCHVAKTTAEQRTRLGL